MRGACIIVERESYFRTSITSEAQFNEIKNVFIVDSIPLEICKNSRANRSKICKEIKFSLTFLLQDIKHHRKNYILIGYRDGFVQLCQYKMISNQKNYQRQKYVFRKSRMRIETLFSQLSDQFRIQNNYAKSFNGFKTKTLRKITALTFIQFVNVFVFGRKVNKIKVSII